jgi:hypothetical protein
LKELREKGRRILDSVGIGCIIASAAALRKLCLADRRKFVERDRWRSVMRKAVPSEIGRESR